MEGWRPAAWLRRKKPTGRKRKAEKRLDTNRPSRRRSWYKVGARSSAPIAVVFVSQKEFSAKRMRSFAAAGLWAAAKKLTLGFALIALFSAILLLSDLAHRKTSSASSGSSLWLPTANRSFKAAIVAIAPSVSTDLCANGMLEGLRQSGISAGKNLE